MTLKALQKKGTQELLSVYDRAEAEASAWFLLAGCFDIDRKDYLLIEDHEVENVKVAEYESMISRRLNHEPTAYILGEWEFMGLPFEVNPSVLIPRPDTETVVEETIHYVHRSFPKGSRIRILDICTGSGCIAVSLGYYLSRNYDLDLSACDLSPKALETAKRNAVKNHTAVRFVCSDLLQAFESETFDIIVCNPPYVASKIVEGLEPDVRDYEPHLALDGGERGLNIYQRLIPQLPLHLTEKGAVFFEIGDEQADDVNKIFDQTHAFSEVKVVKDLAGHHRVVFGKKVEKNV